MHSTQGVVKQNTPMECHSSTKYKINSNNCDNFRARKFKKSGTMRLLSLHVIVIFVIFEGQSLPKYLDTAVKLLEQPGKPSANLVLIQTNLLWSHQVQLTKYIFKQSTVITGFQIVSEIKNLKQVFFTGHRTGGCRFGLAVWITNYHDLALLMDTINVEDLGTKCSVKILLPGFLSEILDKEHNFRLNQEIFVINLSTLEMYEIYRISGAIVKSSIGKCDPKTLTFQFQDPDRWSNEIGKRRANLYGQHLRIMTDHFVPYIQLAPSHKTEAPYFPENGTFDVTHFFEAGIYRDILVHLASNLNFTYSLYKRKDGSYGVLMDNGTVTGMLGDVFRGNADMTAAPTRMMPSR